MPSAPHSSATPSLREQVLTHIKALVQPSVPDYDARRDRQHTDALLPLLAEITGVDPLADLSSSANINTAYGVAISPVQAAKCLQETRRTKVFLQAVNQAILDRAHTGEPISILYAGTGPYGLLVLPLLALHADLPLQACLIDLHPDNIQALDKMIAALEIEPKIVSIDLQDACEWQPEPIHRFDMIVSETMTKLLLHEPQVAIFAHLQQFLKPAGSLIPQTVTLSASLVDADACVDLGEFFTLDQAMSAKIAQQPLFSISGRIALPDSGPRPSSLRLDTYIVAYGDYQLSVGHCSLNMPVFYHRRYFNDLDEITFCYQLDADPRFEFSLPVYQPESVLTSSWNTDALGLYHLKRFWHKWQQQAVQMLDPAVREGEWSLDLALVDLCQGDLQAWFGAMYEPYPPSLADFVTWVSEQHALSSERITQINTQLSSQIQALTPESSHAAGV